MTDITDQHDQGSPSNLDDHTVGNGNSIAGGESRGIKRQRPAAADDDDDDDDKPGRERRKIEIKFITDKSRRHITFSKRKAGIMKKVCANSPQSTRERIRRDATCRFDRILIRILLGLRVICSHRHPGSSSCCLRDGFSLYIYNTEAPAFGHKSRGQEFNSSKCFCASNHCPPN